MAVEGFCVDAEAWRMSLDRNQRVTLQRFSDFLLAVVEDGVLWVIRADSSRHAVPLSRVLWLYDPDRPKHA